MWIDTYYKDPNLGKVDVLTKPTNDSQVNDIQVEQDNHHQLQTRQAWAPHKSQHTQKKQHFQPLQVLKYR